VACHDTPDTNEARGLKKRCSSVDFPAKINENTHINIRLLALRRPFVYCEDRLSRRSEGRCADSERRPAVAPGLGAENSKQGPPSTRASGGKCADSERRPAVASGLGASSSKQGPASSRASGGKCADNARTEAEIGEGGHRHVARAGRLSANLEAGTRDA
jgi:hypothetical protein